MEVAIIEGKGGMQMTGQMGEVMQESAKTARSYVWSHAAALGIDPGRELMDGSRPVPITDQGRPIAALF